VPRGRQLTGEIEGDQDILTRDECLRILSEMAQKGSVSAASALERALRLEDPDEEEEDDLFAELDRLRRGAPAGASVTNCSGTVRAR
jgi:hypothetical protein